MYVKIKDQIACIGDLTTTTKIAQINVINFKAINVRLTIIKKNQIFAKEGQTAAGFEPAHGGVKVHCLTTWLC